MHGACIKIETFLVFVWLFILPGFQFYEYSCQSPLKFLVGPNLFVHLYFSPCAVWGFAVYCHIMYL